MKFETIYRKAARNLNSKDFDSHCEIYVKFITLLKESLGIKDSDSVNVYHVERNMYKPRNQGGETIKSMCETAFWVERNAI